MDLKKLNFNKAGLEKVQRLIPILEFLNSGDRNGLFALKGGTAINLFLLSFKRLSVDIDLDYMVNDLKEKVYIFRKDFNTKLEIFMNSLGYTLSPKSFHTYALSSFVFKYKNLSGNVDNLKIEINYANRTHVFEAENHVISKPWTNKPFNVLVTNHIELFASKFSALIMRSSARDLYDSFRIIKENKISNVVLFKKCFIFYTILSDEGYDNNEKYWCIKTINKYKIKTDLVPLLETGSWFDFEKGLEIVSKWLRTNIVFDINEKKFIKYFYNKEYRPELLFDDKDIVERIKNHPVALWKTRKQM